MTTQPIVFEDTTLYPVFDPVFDFLLTNREVAKGFGTSIQNIIVAKNRNSDELIEGKHYLRLGTQTNGGVQKVIHLTKIKSRGDYYFLLLILKLFSGCHSHKTLKSIPHMANFI